MTDPLTDARAVPPISDEALERLYEQEHADFIVALVNAFPALCARIAQAERENRITEEREAACCPEDYAFPEWIAVLTKRLAAAEAKARARDALDRRHAHVELRTKLATVLRAISVKPYPVRSDSAWIDEVLGLFEEEMDRLLKAESRRSVVR